MSSDEDAAVPTEADYVIVGGGTAGLVLAARLSEDPETTVIILEAGKDLSQDRRVLVPWEKFGIFRTEANWSFKTVPQAHLYNRTNTHALGRMLGGSSAINAQVWSAASQATINAWSELGNSSWTWDSLLPYYKKSYTLDMPNDEVQEKLRLQWVDRSVHGTAGPVKVSFVASPADPLTGAWLDTFKGMNYLTNADPHSGDSVGAYCNLASMDQQKKTRSSSASAYWSLAASRSNVHLVTEALVHKILLQSSAPPLRASGVEFAVNGTIRQLFAKKEVIVAAGAINSPKLLELSGIGDKALLSRHGIATVIDNPNVGENFQDHLLNMFSVEAADGTATLDGFFRREPGVVEAAQKEYAESRTGPLTNGGMQCSAFMPMLEFAGPDGPLKLQQLFDRYLPASSATSKYHTAVRRILEHPGGTSCQMFFFAMQAGMHVGPKTAHFSGGEMQPGNYLSFGIIQSVPFSRGSTHIASSDPADKPATDPKFFSHPLDEEIMARNLLDLNTLPTRSPMSSHVKPAGRRAHPDSHLTDLDSAKHWLRATAGTVCHPCGTNAMLPQAEGGVVDEALRVYGTTNLRVVDASVFPVIPRGNIQTTVYAVAERAADIIRGNI